MLSIKAVSARIRNARLDLTAIIKHLKQYCPEKKKKNSQTGYGVITTFLDSSQAHLAPAHRHSGPLENFAGDEVMHCVLAPGEETSFRPRVSSDLRSAPSLQSSEDKHDSLCTGSPPACSQTCG